MLDKRSVQTVSTPFNIFKKRENVESMLNESLNQFKFDSTSFEHLFTLSTMLKDLFKSPRHLVQQLCWTHVEANVCFLLLLLLLFSDLQFL